MIERSFNPNLLREASGEYNMGPDEETWLGLENNVMLVRGEDVGCGTFDYPGLYTCHWFFKSKGREALESAVQMLDVLFSEYDAKLVRGLVHVDHKPSKFLAKYLGFERISIEEFLDGPNELLLLPKETFQTVRNKYAGLRT